MCFVAIFRILGVTFVFNISDVTIAISFVGDDLGTTIGQGNTVRSCGDFTIATLRVAIVVVRRGIDHIIKEAVRLGRLMNTIIYSI